jgi:hypothetical protein
MFYISNLTIQQIKELIYLEDIEFCGNLLKNEELTCNIIQPIAQNELLLFIEVVGEISSCLNKTYTKYHWHTHSKNSKGYPSSEDIMLPIRKRPTHCLVFTIFGVYEIICNETHDITSEKKQDIMKKYIQPNLDKIYKYTERGRTKNLTNEQIKYINHYLDEIQNILKYRKNINVQIFFTPWIYINDIYMLHL